MRISIDLVLMHVEPGKDTYAGEFKDGKFHGHGEHTFPDGERYDGEWRFGMQHGIGLKSWPDGTVRSSMSFRVLFDLVLPSRLLPSRSSSDATGWARPSRGSIG